MVVKKYGKFGFGFAPFMPYSEKTGDWEELKNARNNIDRAAVIAHIEDEDVVDFGASAMLPEIDPETGEKIEAGIYMDGPFVFPAGFFHQYKYGRVGIPREYEDYLHREFGL